MFKRSYCLLFCFFLGACMTSADKMQQPAANTAMPEGQRADPPKGFEDFCKRHPAECRLPATEPHLQGINRANLKAKSLITPTPETKDFWQTRQSPGPGDCEDFALTMRSLMRAAFPAYSGAFLIATAHTETGQYHAVLSIETTRGTIVCDIRFPDCMPWEQFPYIWRYREVADADHWQEIGPLAVSKPAIEAGTASSRGR